MESEEKDMTVIGEFRYVNHYFKIYEDGEIYVDYKPLGKVYADGDIWIARKRMGKIYADGEIWLANEKVGCLTLNKELWVNGKRVATGVGRPTNSKSSGNTASKSKGTSENKTYQTPKPPVTTETGIPDMSGVEIAVFLVAICLAVSILYETTQIFLHGGLLGSTYRQYAGQSKLVDLLIYGIPSRIFALVTGLQCAFEPFIWCGFIGIMQFLHFGNVYFQLGNRLSFTGWYRIDRILYFTYFDAFNSKFGTGNSKHSD